MFGGGATRNAQAFGRMSANEMLGFESYLWTFNATTDDWKQLFSYQKCLTHEGCDTNAHGTVGPLHDNTFEPDSILGGMADLFMAKFGMKWIDDSNDGTNLGMSVMHRNIKVSAEGVFRQDSYCDLLKGVIASRFNLKVVSNALITKVILRKNGQKELSIFTKEIFLQIRLLMKLFSLRMLWRPLIFSNFLELVLVLNLKALELNVLSAILMLEKT